MIILVAGPQESRQPLAGSSMRRLQVCASFHSVRSSVSVVGNIQITQVLCVVMDQGTEKWLLTSRWMLWLAPAGLRGGLKLEAYHQSRQPQSFFLCGPRCSGTSDRCSGRCGVISYALLRQPYLRPRRCGDLGFVLRHKPAEHHTPDVPAAPEASCITSCRGRRVSFSTRRCGVTVCLQLRRSYLVLPAGSDHRCHLMRARR